jgi:tryptophan halogenase
VPDSLAHTLDQFETRGRLPFYEEETFEPQSWLAVLAGLELLPRAIDPVSARMELEPVAHSMAALAQRLADLPSRIPAYSDYIRRMIG